jgi:Fe-S cluster assembly iron-binding protein IscA
MQIVKLDPGIGDAIKSILAAKALMRPLRIDLHSTGCCDAALGLCIDTIHETDLVQEADGLTFIISPDIHQLIGEVTISRADDKDKPGFIMTSTKPVSEWDGFGVCTIRT